MTSFLWVWDDNDRRYACSYAHAQALAPDPMLVDHDKFEDQDYKNDTERAVYRDLLKGGLDDE